MEGSFLFSWKDCPLLWSRYLLPPSGKSVAQISVVLCLSLRNNRFHIRTSGPRLVTLWAGTSSGDNEGDPHEEQYPCDNQATDSQRFIIVMKSTVTVFVLICHCGECRSQPGAERQQDHKIHWSCVYQPPVSSNACLFQPALCWTRFPLVSSAKEITYDPQTPSLIACE